MSLPDESIQKAVDEWVDGKLGEDLRKPYPERNELVQQLREEMHAAFAEKLGEEYDDAAKTSTTKPSNRPCTKMSARALSKTTSVLMAAN